MGCPDFIDLNFGCPVNKVVAKNGGSALLKDCPTLSSVAKAVVQAVAPLPVTAKIRIGWDADSVNAVRVAGILQGCGIAALAVHGRTRAQGYSGEADWRVIGEVAEGVAIPVIGNGDLFSAQEVVRPGPAMDGQSRDAALLQNFRDSHRVDGVGIPTNSNFCCHGQWRDRLHYRFGDAAECGAIFQESGAAIFRDHFVNRQPKFRSMKSGTQSTTCLAASAM